jgi:tRNA nucleotidyltransferase (CCA-adding enzyme)
LDEWRDADEESRIVYSLAILAHDFAKPETTHRAPRNGRMRIVSPGHEEAGGAVAERFLERIHAPEAIRSRVVPLVKNHLAHLNELSDRSVRRLARRLEPENIDGLSIVMTADHFGRPPLPKVIPEGIVALRAKAAELHVQASAPSPILMGRHLIELGLKPGKKFGVILDQAYDAQLEGTFGNLNEARHWLAERTEFDFSDAVIAALLAGRGA